MFTPWWVCWCFSGGTRETLSSVWRYNSTRLNMHFCRLIYRSVSAPPCILTNRQNGHYTGVGLCKGNIKWWSHGNGNNCGSYKINTCLSGRNCECTNRMLCVWRSKPYSLWMPNLMQGTEIRLSESLKKPHMFPLWGAKSFVAELFKKRASGLSLQY